MDDSIEAMAARQRARNMELEADADDVDSLLMPSPSPHLRANNPLRSFPAGPTQDPVVMAAARASRERRNAENGGSANSTPASSGDGPLSNRGAEQNRYPMHPPAVAATPPPPVPANRGDDSSPRFGVHAGGNGGGGQATSRPNSGNARPRSSRAAAHSTGQPTRPGSSSGGGPPPSQAAQGSMVPSPGRGPGVEMESGGTGTAGMGDESAARYLRARVTALQQQVDHFSGQASDLGQRLKEAESNAKHDQEEARKVHRAHAALSDKLEKEASSRQAAEVEAARLREEVSRLRSEVETTKRGARAAGGEARSRDVQLTRAQEEVTKHKEQLAALRAAKSEEAENQRNECGKLEAKVSRLERQKSELLSAFKKQAKLVDVLRRQRVHVEAARALAFTEEEFMKTLDWGA